VDVGDAILVLKVLAGLNPEGVDLEYVTPGADVDGDGKIGVTEMLYVLQHVSGLR
jgi:hypothetical protein